ncbi:MAG: response regulator [Anaerolineaceae bacterium]|nr:response regulator [Anaerolineaceae bacterium]MDD4043613.1 response regulator [Anaerolineaceae bacterium]MDD4577264.1 response regulator [Anaerolineaceae bacterium]
MNNTLSILIIEKDPPLQQTLALLFKRSGHNVSSAPLNRHILTIPEKQTADVIVLDLNQSNDNGLALFFKIKKDYPLVPVILLSGNSEKEIIPCIDEEKEWVLIRKPFDPGFLLRTVQAIAGNISIHSPKTVGWGAN